MPGRPITAAKNATALSHQSVEMFAALMQAAPGRCQDLEGPMPTDKVGIWWRKSLWAAFSTAIATMGVAQELCKKAGMEYEIHPDADWAEGSMPEAAQPGTDAVHLDLANETAGDYAKPNRIKTFPRKGE